MHVNNLALPLSLCVVVENISRYKVGNNSLTGNKRNFHVEHKNHSFIHLFSITTHTSIKNGKYKSTVFYYLVHVIYLLYINMPIIDTMISSDVLHV